MAMTSSRPEVRYIYQNHHLDTTRWDGFQPRPDDIIISTAYKSGTTLMQTIVLNLLFPDGDLPGPVTLISPWLDMRVAPLEEIMGALDGMPFRRCIKTHLALDGLPYYDEAKYLMVGRDPRDVFMSLLHHWGSHTAQFYEMINAEGRPGPEFPHFEDDPHKLFRQWITRGWFEWESDGYPYWSMLHHAKTWWEFRHLPNIELVHYSDLRADLDGEMRKIADYLEIDVPASKWDVVVHACKFETVKANPEKIIFDLHKEVFKDGGTSFINKGTNGRWRDVLTDEELDLYRQAMERTLPPDCARWLEQGGAYA
jgi:aryl sulfotransferase